VKERREFYPLHRGEHLEKVTYHLSKQISNSPNTDAGLKSQVEQNTQNIQSLQSQTNNLSITSDTQTSAILAANEEITRLSAKTSANEMNILNNASNITTLQEEMAGVKEDTSENSSAVSALNEEVSTMSSAVSTLNSEVSTLSSEVETASSKVDSFEDKINANEMNILNNASNITALQEEMAGVKEDTSENSSAVSALSEEVATMSSAVSTLNSEVSTLSSEVEAASSKVNSFEGKISANEMNILNNASNITTLEGEVENVKSAQTALSSTVTALSSEVAGLEGEVSTLSSEVEGLSSEVEAASSKVDSFEGKISANEMNILNNASNITALEGEVENVKSAQTALSSTVTALSSEVTGLEGEVSTNSSTISTLSDTISTLNDKVSANSTEIESLKEAVSAGGGGGSGSGDSSDTLARLEALEIRVAENEAELKPLQIHAESTANIVDVRALTSLEYDIFENEPLTHNGGTTPDFAIGRKGANMFGVLWARINPRHNAVFAGEVVLTLDSVPAGKTTASLTLTINGEATALTPSIDAATNQIRLPFNLTASGVCWEFRVDFADSELADVTLNYMRLEVTEGANFACVNHDNKYEIITAYSTTNKQYIFLTKNLGSVQEVKYLYKYYTEEWQREVGFDINPFVDENGAEVYFAHFSTMIEINYSTTTGKLATALVYDLVGVERDTSRLVHINDDNKVLNVMCDEAVYDGHMCFSNEFADLEDPKKAQYISFCGTTYAQRAFIGSLGGELAADVVTLGGEALPEEFVQAVPVIDKGYQLLRNLPDQAGYVLVHKTGEIFYIPYKHSEYMVRVGRGKNVTAYVGYAPVPSHDPATSTLASKVNPLHVRNGEINIYFALLDGSGVVKRTLKLDSETSRYNLLPSMKLLPNLDAVYELDWKRIITVKERNYIIE